MVFPYLQGPWVQRQVPNPDFYEDDAPLQNGVAAVGAVALELWTVDQGYMFDNVLITRDPGAAEEARERLWKPRHAAEVRGSDEWGWSTTPDSRGVVHSVYSVVHSASSCRSCSHASAPEDGGCGGTRGRCRCQGNWIPHGRRRRTPHPVAEFEAAAKSTP